MALILLVDPDLAVTTTLAAALAEAGHAVETVASAASARQRVGTRKPDVVVLEALLDGGQAGLDLAREMAARHPDLPLFMVTALDDQLDRVTRAAQDHDGWLPVRRFLQKPVDPAVLVDEIGHAVDPAHHA